MKNSYRFLTLRARAKQATVRRVLVLIWLAFCLISVVYPASSGDNDREQVGGQNSGEGSKSSNEGYWTRERMRSARPKELLVPKPKEDLSSEPKHENLDAKDKRTPPNVTNEPN
jgi:hypothetical protein